MGLRRSPTTREAELYQALMASRFIQQLRLSLLSPIPAIEATITVIMAVIIKVAITEVVVVVDIMVVVVLVADVVVVVAMAEEEDVVVVAATEEVIHA